MDRASRPRLRLGAPGLALCLLPLTGCPQTPPPRSPLLAAPRPKTAVEVARRLCRHPEADWRPLFSPRFRRRAPVDGAQARFQTLIRIHGPCRGAEARRANKAGAPKEARHSKTDRAPREARGPGVVWRFERAHVPGAIHLDGQHRVAGLWFHGARVPGDTWARLRADLARLPGRTALTARTGEGRVLATHHPQRALAVGSTFKLFVLKTLAREVQAGRMRWDDVVRLRAGRRSLPPAPLNRWPDGAPLTVYSLATRMIAASDNTATDHLLHHVGRQVVEQHAGTYNRPLLSTREMFLLKRPENEALARQYLRAPPTRRRALLRRIGKRPRPRMKGRPGWTAPRQVDRLEWFFSTAALCEVALELKALPVFRPTRGPARRRRWKRIAYKGGAEPGVRNVTLALQHRRTGRWVCLSLTWNHARARLDRPRFRSLVRRALDLLWRSPPPPAAPRDPAASPARPRDPAASSARPRDPAASPARPRRSPRRARPSGP